MTVDGLTVEAGAGTTAVKIADVTDSGSVTLTNNIIDLTGGDADSVGIDTSDGTNTGSITETVEDNTLEGETFAGEDTEQVFVADSNNRVNLGTIESDNTFTPGVLEDSNQLVAATPVNSQDELTTSFDADRKKLSNPDKVYGGTFALSSGYTDGLDGSDATNNGLRYGDNYYEIDIKNIDTDNTYTNDGGTEVMAAAVVTEDGQVNYQEAP